MGVLILMTVLCASSAAATMPLTAPKSACREAIDRRVGPWDDILRLTLVSRSRLKNAYDSWAHVLEHGFVGDWVETGVFRGACSLLAARVLRAAFLAPECKLATSPRTIWLADSFRGFPEERAEDKGKDINGRKSERACHTKESESCEGFARLYSLEGVKQTFERSGFDAHRGTAVNGTIIRFLSGWFNETLPAAPIRSIAVLRLDGDLYSSTMDALRSLYPKVTVCGYFIVDDFFYFRQCRQAVKEYLHEQHAHGHTMP